MTYVKNYRNRQIFDKTIAKIEGCSFVASHGTLLKMYVFCCVTLYVSQSPRL